MIDFGFSEYGNREGFKEDDFYHVCGTEGYMHQDISRACAENMKTVKINLRQADDVSFIYTLMAIQQLLLGTKEKFVSLAYEALPK